MPGRWGRKCRVGRNGKQSLLEVGQDQIGESWKPKERGGGFDSRLVGSHFRFLIKRFTSEETDIWKGLSEVIPSRWS